MSIRNRSLAALAVVLLVAAQSQADVKITSKMTMSAGAAAMSMSGMQTMLVKGDKEKMIMGFSLPQATQQNTPGQGEMEMAMIMRLDKQVLWMVMPMMKTYSEMSFPDLKKMQAQAMQRMQGDSAAQVMKKVLGGMKLQKSTETKKVLGYPAQKYTLSMGGESDTTGLFQGMRFEMTLWVSNQFPGWKELEACQKKSMELMGGEENFLSTLNPMFSSFGGGLGMDEFMQFAKGANGYPLALDMQMYARGGQSQNWQDAMKKLGPKEKPAAPDTTAKEQLVMSVSMEATAISQKPIADSEFDPPAGYQKGQFPGAFQGEEK